MKKISKVIGGAIIILCLPFAAIIFEINSNFMYLYFGVVIVYLCIILQKNRSKIGFISFSFLSLSLVLSLLNLSGLSRIMSNLSFIGLVTFIICDYLLNKNN